MGINITNKFFTSYFQYFDIIAVKLNKTTFLNKNFGYDKLGFCLELKGYKYIAGSTKEHGVRLTPIDHFIQEVGDCTIDKYRCTFKVNTDPSKTFKLVLGRKYNKKKRFWDIFKKRLEVLFGSKFANFIIKNNNSFDVYFTDYQLVNYILGIPKSNEYAWSIDKNPYFIKK